MKDSIKLLITRYKEANIKLNGRLDTCLALDFNIEAEFIKKEIYLNNTHKNELFDILKMDN